VISVQSARRGLAGKAARALNEAGRHLKPGPPKFRIGGLRCGTAGGSVDGLVKKLNSFKVVERTDDLPSAVIAAAMMRAMMSEGPPDVFAT
jgi:hypothetical protein